MEALKKKTNKSNDGKAKICKDKINDLNKTEAKWRKAKWRKTKWRKTGYIKENEMKQNKKIRCRGKKIGITEKLKIIIIFMANFAGHISLRQFYPMNTIRNGRRLKVVFIY